MTWWPVWHNKTGNVNVFFPEKCTKRKKKIENENAPQKWNESEKSIHWDRLKSFFSGGLYSMSFVLFRLRYVFKRASLGKRAWTLCTYTYSVLLLSLLCFPHCLFGWCPTNFQLSLSSDYYCCWVFSLFLFLLLLDLAAESLILSHISAI